MINKKEYQECIGVPAPSNLNRLEFLALNELRTIMVENVPSSNDILYGTFKKALMEQINYFNMNSDLIDSSSSGSYSLGSYSEGGSSQNNNLDNKNRISPAAYDILLSNGLLYCGLGGA